MANLLGGDNHRTPPEKLAHTARYEKKRFFFVPPARENRFSAQQKQRKSMSIRGQGERTSGRRVAEPQKNRQKRTESHRKRTKFTRNRTVSLQKRTVFRSNGHAFTKRPQTPPGRQDMYIFFDFLYIYSKILSRMPHNAGETMPLW